MEITLQMILIVCPLVFFASCVDAIAGGGGLISLPAYLLTGMPPVYAAGCNKFSACAGTLIATYKYMRGGKLLLKMGLISAAGALIGSFLGAELLKRTPDEVVKIFMLIVIPLMAVITFMNRDRIDRSRPELRTRPVICSAIGLACGFYDGFFGPGTGVLLIMLFTTVVGMDAVTASGTSKLVNLASNVAATVSFLMSGNVLFKLAVPAMLCSVVGGYVGARFALTKGAKAIKYVMMGVLALLMIKLLVEFFAG